MQEAGADAVLEMAFTIADGLQYCRTGMWAFICQALSFTTSDNYLRQLYPVILHKVEVKLDELTLSSWMLT